MQMENFFQTSTKLSNKQINRPSHMIEGKIVTVSILIEGVRQLTRGHFSGQFADAAGFSYALCILSAKSILLSSGVCLVHIGFIIDKLLWKQSFLNKKKKKFSASSHMLDESRSDYSWGVDVVTTLGQLQAGDLI